MKIIDLKKKLIEEKISPDVYSIYGDGNGDCFVIIKEKQKWLVYYSEKGERYGIKSFENEDDACEYFQNQILTSSAPRQKIFCPSDFNHSSIWTGNDSKGYTPLSEKSLVLTNYPDLLFIKSTFRTNNRIFHGYLVWGAHHIDSFGIFINGKTIKINTKFKVFTDENINTLFTILGCKPFEFFPVQYESDIVLNDTHKISGTIEKIESSL